MAEVRLEIDLTHPSERVWHALTDRQILSEWFMPNDLTVGDGDRFTLEPGTLPGFLGPVTGELIEVQPPRRLVMLWQGEKLHTRVVWELTDTEDGCRLQVVQSGFIGAPAALRVRALRGTYQQLFGSRLPLILDRLAATGSVGGAPQAARAGRITPLTTLRSQRHRNLPVAAWQAGRTLSAGPAAADDRAPVDAPASVGPAATPEPPESVPARAVSRHGARSRPLPLRAWAQAVRPRWLRGLAVGTACVVVAALVFGLALAMGSFDRRNPVTDPDLLRNPRGVAMQPGSVPTAGVGAEEPDGTPPPGDAGSGDAGSEGGVPVGSGGQSEGGGGAAGSGPVRPVTPPEASGPPAPLPQPSQPVPGPPESPPGPPVPPPGLTARMQTSGLPLLGGRSVTITVSNPGPGPATTWEVVVDVGSQDVTNVTGASYVRDGSLAIFRAIEELPAQADAVINFTIPAPLLGLLGAQDPTSCTINGQPCD